MIELLIANLPMVLCLMMGMALMIVEVFLPGFGLPGISGIALVGIGVVIAGINYGAVTAVGLLLVLIAVLAVVISLVLNHVVRGGGNSKIFLRETQDLNPQEDMKAFVGRKGEAKSMLRPAGIGDFDGVRLNVVTEGGFVDAGTAIEIVNVIGNRIIVKPC
ncbi:MAG: hypothetical protein IKU34_08880 [Clostridia bacterium]|nr:hypothetical protein [Clostridia bacterium]